MPHVVQMSSVHHLADHRILNKESMTLADAGYQVSIVIPHPQDEIVGTIKVHAVPRLTGRFNRIFKTTYAVARKALSLNGEIYHFHDPELIPVGIFLKLCGKKVFYDIHEDLPLQIRAKTWIPALLRQPVAAAAWVAERVGSWLFDGIIAATPPIAHRFPKSKTVVVQNFPMLEEFELAAGMPYSERQRRLVYIGSLTPIRGVFQMLDAINLSTDPDTRLDIAGRFQDAALQAAAERHPGWRKVYYHSWLSRTGVAELIGKTRVGLVPLHPCANYLESYPVKLFEYMAAGIPVVASNFPLWNSIIKEVNCGLTVDPLNPKEIHDAAMWLLSNEQEAAAMGERGRHAINQIYNWQSEAKKLVAYYKKFATF